MIDILKAKNEFKNYVSKFDHNEERIKLKIAHIERTSQVARKIAKHLNIDEEDVELAELIGLLHDIGRFEQVRLYNTFVDRDSVNHGELGVKILFEDGLIRNFIDNDKYDEIIKKAILNHNRASIEPGLDDKTLMHAKIIRDADKVDICYISTIGDKKAIWEKADLSKDKISDEIFEQFINNKYIDYKKIESSADILVAHFAYVYDFNYSYSLKIVRDNNYIEQIYNRFVFEDEDTKRKMEAVYNAVKEFLDKNKD